jgi:hypothetical protein
VLGVTALVVGGLAVVGVGELTESNGPLRVSVRGKSSVQVDSLPRSQYGSVSFTETVKNTGAGSIAGLIVHYPRNDGNGGVDIGTSASASCGIGDVASAAQFFDTSSPTLSGEVCRIAGGLQPGRTVRLSLDLGARTPQGVQRIKREGVRVAIAPASYLH